MENFYYFSQLKGAIPSSISKDKIFYYTNYGGIELDLFSKDVVYACIGFKDYSIEGGDKHVSIKILKNEVSIRLGSLYKENSELATSGYPYKLQHYSKPDMVRVFNILYNAAPMTQGIIAVIFKIDKLIRDKLNNSERKALDDLLNLIRFRYPHNIIRIPIIRRTPIKVERTPIKEVVDIIE